MANSCDSPRPSRPISRPRAPSKPKAQVGEPCRPIFSSRRRTAMGLRAPSASTLGTRNRLSPAPPGAAPGVRASRQWPIRGARSWSPKVIQAFSPVIDQSPSPAGVARVRMRPTSEPASASEMQMVEAHSPEPRRGSHSALVASSAWASSRRAAAAWDEGSMPKATQARSNSSWQAAQTTSGRPWPPCASGLSRLGQPASRKARQASAWPGAVLTRPASRRQPSRSITGLSGASASSANRAASSRTASAVSGNEGSPQSTHRRWTPGVARSWAFSGRVSKAVISSPACWGGGPAGRRGRTAAVAFSG